jgi:histidinol-phosphatase
VSDRRHELSPGSLRELREHALRLADAARILILDARAHGVDVKHKSDGSVVTNADTAVETELRGLVARRYPEHGVLGEEFPATRPDAPFQWVFDPIDGTEDFIHGVPTYGSIIGVYYHGLPIVGVIDHPSLDLRCEAAFGLGLRHNGKPQRITDLAPGTTDQRLRVVTSARANFLRFRDHGAHFDAITHTFPNHRTYRSCLGHTLAAIGAVDVMVDYQDSRWDLAAACILMEEAGGIYRTLDEFTVENQLYTSAVFGKPAAVARVCAALESARSGHHKWGAR